MSGDGYNKSFQFLEKDWEVIYERPKGSIADYLRGMCEFVFFGIVPPKSERTRFLGYDTISRRLAKGKGRRKKADTYNNTPNDTTDDTIDDTAVVIIQGDKDIKSSILGKEASDTRSDVLTREEVLAHVTGINVSSNLRPDDPESFTAWFIDEMRKASWLSAQGRRLNHGQAIRLIGFKLDDWKKNTARAAVENPAVSAGDPKYAIDYDGVM